MKHSPARATTRIAAALVGIALIVTTLVYQFPVSSVIDVGSGRDAPFIENFSFRENLPDSSTMRWSNGHGEIRFYGVGAQDGVLKLRLAAPRPQSSAHVQVLANGAELAQYTPSNDFQEQAFPISRALIGLGGDLIVSLNSDTFSQPPDTRELGLMVDSARFEPVGAPVFPSPHALFYLPMLVALVFLIGLAWSDNRIAALGLGAATLVLGAIGLLTVRSETAYFIVPLFWTVVALVLFGYLLRAALQRLTSAMNAPDLRPRTLCLVLVAMGAALAFRLIFDSSPGYIVDTQDYIVWSYKTVTYGLGTMYSAIHGLWISDQSPGLNYILHVMGLLYRGIFAPDFLYPAVAGDPALRSVTTNPAALADPIQRALLRLPQLLADVVTGALIFTAARKYVAEKFAWLAALVFWFNPAVLWNATFWGQTDAIHTLLVLICFLLLVYTPRVGLALFILGIAAFTKPQAMIFGPLLLLAAYKSPAASRGKGAKWWSIVRAVVFGVLGSALVLLPIIVAGGADGLLAYFGDTVGHHPILSANAHNLWWLLFQGNIDVADTRALFPNAPLSFRAFSIFLFGIAYAVALVRAWRAPLEKFFELGAFVAFAFFMLPTEIHENYGYALLPLLAIAMTRDYRLIVFYVAISVTMTLNYALHDPNLYERFGLQAPDMQWGTLRWFNSLLNAVVFGAWSLSLFLPEAVQFSFAKMIQPQRAVK